jgi:hypothetical protein
MQILADTGRITEGEVIFKARILPNILPDRCRASGESAVPSFFRTL